MTSITHTHAHTHTHAAPDSPASRLLLALGVTLLFVAVEAFAGWRANSLALLTDAAHNITDVIALAFSWLALRLTARPAHSRQTYGYHRAGILVALGNALTLLLVAFGILYEAYHRVWQPPVVEAQILIGMAALAFLVNAGTAWLVRSGSDHDLNLRSAFVHLAADAVSTLGALLAGIGIALTGQQVLDPLASVLIAGLIVWNAGGIIRETIHILLQGAPRDVDVTALVTDLTRLQGVRGVHDLHLWSLTQDKRVLSAHVLTDDMPISAGAEIQSQINRLLAEDYGIAHATLQLECEACQPELYCDLNCEATTPADAH